MKPRIVVYMIWYDEEPNTLFEACASLSGFAEALVALDGRFAFFPAEAPASSLEQAGAIAHGCENANLELLLYRPIEAGVWPGWNGNEIEKRNAGLRLAGLFEPEWVAVIDADWVLQPGWEVAHERLAESDLLVAGVSIGDALWRRGGDIAVSGLFRWTPTLRYERTHFEIRRDEDTLLTFTLDGRGVPVESLDFTDCVHFQHIPKTAERQALQDEWYRIRDELGLEMVA